VAQDPADQNSTPPGGDPELGALQARLEAAKQAEADRQAREHVPLRDGRSIAGGVAATMLGYPLGGIVVGWGLDTVFHTRPWIMIVLMFLAFAGACMQVVRGNNQRNP